MHLTWYAVKAEWWSTKWAIFEGKILIESKSTMKWNTLSSSCTVTLYLRILTIYISYFTQCVIFFIFETDQHCTIINTVWWRYNTVNFPPNPHKRHCIPCRWGWVRYGVLFVNITPDACFASVIVKPYAKSCYVGPRYNGTALFYTGSRYKELVLFISSRVLSGIRLKACNLMQVNNPDSKVHGANMGPIWGWQDPGGPHVGPMNLVVWEAIVYILQMFWRVLTMYYEATTLYWFSITMYCTGPVFCLLLGVSSGCAWPITGQVTSVTWPVIGWT